MRKVVVIDGQGGRLGAQLVERLRTANLQARIVAVGTNSIATAAMLKAGADAGATGENPVVVNCRDADAVLGPIGILAADALHGEVTPAMAVAVGQSPAPKILLPWDRCNHYIAGMPRLSQTEMVEKAVEQLRSLWNPARIAGPF